MRSRLSLRNRPSQPPTRRPFRPRLERLEERWLPTTLANGLPVLHSMPGAPTAIYLDFTGHGSDAPYDEDGNPSTYNASEQSHITSCWRQVSSYFSMFDVDVTTIHPTVPFAWDLISNSISGGYSSVGAFPDSSPRSFNEASDARGRVSGIAHELGHNFGLQHQSNYDLMGNKTAEYSTGVDALHDPIMGVDYAGSVHKWIIGHPSTSASALQDDLAVIASKIKRYERAGGDGFRPHTQGGTIATATPLAVSGQLQSASGVIARLTDTDAYSFSSYGGATVLSLQPPAPSALRGKLSVYDAAGRLLATADAATSNNAQQLTLNLPAGTYYALVTSHGDYGDLGEYSLGVRSLPTDWQTRDIGSVRTAGYVGYDPAADTFTVAGSGANVGGTADAFRFAYLTLTGDGAIFARVTRNQNTAAGAKVGLMLRDSLAANAQEVSMTTTAGNGPQMLWRASTGGPTTTYAPSSGAFSRLSLGIIRQGNTFIAYTSTDGTHWTEFDRTTVSMHTTVYVGLLSSAGSSTTTALDAGLVDRVGVVGDVTPPPPGYNGLPAPGNLSLSPTTGTGVHLGWAAVAGATGYAVERSANGADWARVGTTAAGVTTYTDANPGSSQRFFYRVSALNAAGASVPSAVGSVVNHAAAASHVTVTSWQTTRLILNWRDVSGDSGYRVERSLDGVNFVTAGTVGKNVPSFTDSGLSAGTTYYYRIVTLSAGGGAIDSAVVSGSTRAADAPSGGGGSAWGVWEGGTPPTDGQAPAAAGGGRRGKR